MRRPLRVNVVKKGTQIRLKDRTATRATPRVNVVDINKGNMQIAHGIDRVLRPTGPARRRE